MRSRTSCEQQTVWLTRTAPNDGCTPATPEAGECDSQRRLRRRFQTTPTTSERENPMPDDRYPYPPSHAGRECPDVDAEFCGSTPSNVYLDLDDDGDDGEELWPEPEDDDLGLLERSARAASLDYECTTQELEEAGFGNGYIEEQLAAAPDVDHEFVPEPVGDAALEAVAHSDVLTLRDLLDSVERVDWTAMPGLMRLASALIEGMLDPCPLTSAA